MDQTFALCAHNIGEQFGYSQDMHGLSYLHVAALLERGIQVLVYVGENDWICNWMGNLAWTMLCPDMWKNIIFTQYQRAHLVFVGARHLTVNLQTSQVRAHSLRQFGSEFRAATDPSALENIVQFTSDRLTCMARTLFTMQ